MYIIVFVTTKDKAEAGWIAEKLLKEKLAACVNIVDKVESHFWWNGGAEISDEAMLIIKSKKALFTEIEAAVKSLHSYECPEIIAIDISAGSRDYLKWVDDNVKKPEGL